MQTAQATPQRFASIAHYAHAGPGRELGGISGAGYSLALLDERSDHVSFPQVFRNGIALDLSGTDRHFTRLDGNSDNRPTRRDDVLLIPQGVDLEVEWTVKPTGQTTLVMEFDTDFLAKAAPELDPAMMARGHLVPGHYDSRPTLARIARLLANQIMAPGQPQQLYLDCVLRLLALHVMAAHWTVPQVPETTARNRDNRIDRAIDYIRALYPTEIALADICRASGMSPTHLTALFQRETGRTPYSYVIDVRLERAVDLLRTTGLPIAQIAVDVGFSDQQHMTRAFRTRLAQTPGEVRRAGTIPSRRAHL